MMDVCFVELEGFTKEVMRRTRVEGFAVGQETAMERKVKFP
jgi:hypothetical protein